MFTGIVEQMGRVVGARDEGGYLNVTLAPERPWPDVELGESVACNGACLTVTARDDAGFSVQLSHETLAKTAPRWGVGEVVNLERSLRLGDRLGGHLVSGHVDGVGTVLSVAETPGAFIIDVEAPAELAKYLVPKGSVAVDGVSLTVVAVGGRAGNAPELREHEFRLWLVPHTLAVTSLKSWRAGTRVNLEADPLAKHLERLVALREGSPV